MYMKHAHGAMRKKSHAIEREKSTGVKSQKSKVCARVSLPWTAARACAATEDPLDDLFGNFSGQIHPAFTYGVVVYVWVTAACPRQDELRQMLVRYLSTRSSTSQESSRRSV